jgi:HlyD family secretion protein
MPTPHDQSMTIAIRRLRPLGWLRSLPRAWWWILGVAACLLMAAMGSYEAYQSRVQSRLPHYQTRTVDRGPIDQTVLTTGTLQPVLTVNVGSQISGQVIKVLVDFNSEVKKGQVMAQLDPRNLQAQRQQAQADLDNAQAALQSAMANVENAHTAIDTARVGVESSRAGLAVAQAALHTAEAQEQQALAARNKAQANETMTNLTLRRERELLAQHFIAQQDVDTANAAWLGAKADVANADGQVALARAGIVSARANLLTAQAALDTARVKQQTAEAQYRMAVAQRNQASVQIPKSDAALREILVNLEYVDIKAPVDGVVISRLVDPGQTVASSFQTPVMFTVATDLKRMQVWANVDETDVSKVFLGQDVTFTVNAWPGVTFGGGKVVQIRNNFQTIQNVVTYQVLVDIRNDELKLRPGMTANLTMEVARRDDALRCPNTALRFRPEGVANEGGSAANRAWLLQDGRLVGQTVKTGITDGVYTEVLDESLHEGDVLAVGMSSATASPSPASSLRPPRIGR